jgi:hypothetical protein
MRTTILSAFYENAGLLIITRMIRHPSSWAGRSGRRYGAYFAAKHSSGLTGKP